MSPLLSDGAARNTAPRDTGTSSAVPDHLMAYANRCGALDDQTASVAIDLTVAIQAFRASRSEFGLPLPDLDTGLADLTTALRQLSREVGDVGAAFAVAGGVPLNDSRFDNARGRSAIDRQMGQAVTVPDARLAATIQADDRAVQDAQTAADHMQRAAAIDKQCRPFHRSGPADLPPPNGGQLTPGSQQRLIDSGETVDQMRQRVRQECRDAIATVPSGIRYHSDDLDKGLSSASNTELAMIDDLLAHGMTPHDLGQFLCGGHVVIHDGGALFHQWESMSNQLHDRSGWLQSSHHTNGRQLAMSGNLVKEALFSTNDDGHGGTDSWIQAEAFPAYFNSPGDALSSAPTHGSDLPKKLPFPARLLATTVDPALGLAPDDLNPLNHWNQIPDGANNGPYGHSPLTQDSNPISLGG